MRIDSITSVASPLGRFQRDHLQERLRLLAGQSSGPELLESRRPGRVALIAHAAKGVSVLVLRRKPERLQNGQDAGLPFLRAHHVSPCGIALPSASSQASRSFRSSTAVIPMVTTIPPPWTRSVRRPPASSRSPHRRRPRSHCPSQSRARYEQKPRSSSSGLPLPFSGLPLPVCLCRSASASAGLPLPLPVCLCLSSEPFSCSLLLSPAFSCSETALPTRSTVTDRSH